MRVENSKFMFSMLSGIVIGRVGGYYFGKAIGHTNHMFPEHFLSGVALLFVPNIYAKGFGAGLILDDLADTVVNPLELPEFAIHWGTRLRGANNAEE